MASTIITLKSTNEPQQLLEHEAIHALHNILTAKQLIALAEYAADNPDKVGKIIDAIESGSSAKLIGLAGTLFSAKKTPKK